MLEARDPGRNVIGSIFEDVFKSYRNVFKCSDTSHCNSASGLCIYNLFI